MMNSINWICFEPVEDKLVLAYSLTNRMVSMLSMSYLVAFPLINFLSIYTIEKYGCRKSILIGLTFQTIGCWLRKLINVNFNLVIAG